MLNEKFSKSKFIELSLIIFLLNLVIILGALGFVKGDKLEFNFAIFIGGLGFGHPDPAIFGPSGGIMLNKYFMLPLLIIVQFSLFYAYIRGKYQTEMKSQSKMSPESYTTFNLGLQSVLPWFAIFFVPASYKNSFGVILVLVSVFIYLLLSMWVVSKILKMQ